MRTKEKKEKPNIRGEGKTSKLSLPLERAASLLGATLYEPRHRYWPPPQHHQQSS